MVTVKLYLIVMKFLMRVLVVTLLGLERWCCVVLIGISGWSVVFVRVEIYDIYRGIVVYY